MDEFSCNRVDLEETISLFGLVYWHQTTAHYPWDLRERAEADALSQHRVPAPGKALHLIILFCMFRHPGTVLSLNVIINKVACDYEIYEKTA